ncbi:MAG: hypothetical protein QOD84_3260, partial [Acidobacteriaceae bacterium]
QYVIESLDARFGSIDGNRQVLFNLGLSNKLSQPLRTQLQLKRRIIFNGSGGNEPVIITWKISTLKIRILSGSHCQGW